MSFVWYGTGTWHIHAQAHILSKHFIWLDYYNLFPAAFIWPHCWNCHTQSCLQSKPEFHFKFLPNDWRDSHSVEFDSDRNGCLFFYFLINCSKSVKMSDTNESHMCLMHFSCSLTRFVYSIHRRQLHTIDRMRGVQNENNDFLFKQ